MKNQKRPCFFCNRITECALVRPSPNPLLEQYDEVHSMIRFTAASDGCEDQPHVIIRPRV
jgi:hypothetical protein